MIIACLWFPVWNGLLSGTQQEDQWNCGHEEDQTWIWGWRGECSLNCNLMKYWTRCLQQQSARSPCWRSCSIQTLSLWRMCSCRRPSSTSSLSSSLWTSRSTWTQMCQRFSPSSCVYYWSIYYSGWTDGSSACEILHLPAFARIAFLPSAKSPSQVFREYLLIVTLNL